MLNKLPQTNSTTEALLLEIFGLKMVFSLKLGNPDLPYWTRTHLEGALHHLKTCEGYLTRFGPNDPLAKKAALQVLQLTQSAFG